MTGWLDLARERGVYTPGSGRDNSSFKKPAQSSGNTVFIKGFNSSLGEDQIRSSLEEHFGSCGEITRVSIPKEYETGASKGSGLWVSFLISRQSLIISSKKILQTANISKFKSFSYLYDEEHFVAALSNDVAIVRSLPKDLREARKKIKFPTVSPKIFATPEYYITEVLPRLAKSKVMGIIVNGGKCLQPILPASLEEFQRLRCRVAFHALKFRPEIRAFGSQIIGRLRASGRPYLAYHPGLLRDTLAFHGCAELFQDIHTELIQYRRNQMIKRGTVKEQLLVDSVSRKISGSCPLMPEELPMLKFSRTRKEKLKIKKQKNSKS